jgi:D-3-phosphoglycerate dehydrogenase
LIQKIEDNHFKGVAIDVIQNEQLKNNRLDKLIELSENYNLIITPHIAGATYSSMYKTEEFIVEKLYLELL